MDKQLGLLGPLYKVHGQRAMASASQRLLAAGNTFAEGSCCPPDFPVTAPTFSNPGETMRRRQKPVHLDILF